MLQIITGTGVGSYKTKQNADIFVTKYAKSKFRSRKAQNSPAIWNQELTKLHSATEIKLGEGRKADGKHELMLIVIEVVA